MKNDFFADAVAIPLIIGVAGHHDLVVTDLGGIEQQVAAVLDRLQGLARHSPCLLLLALAEGADQLVARAALARGGRRDARTAARLFLADITCNISQ